MREKKRVLIIGNAPIPLENALRSYAPGIRTWNFACAAKDANCVVKIIGCRIPKAYEKDMPEIKHEKLQDIEYFSVDPHLFENGDWLMEEILKFHPDCIVGVNTHPCSIISQLNLPAPFWADLNGAAMAEAQAKASLYDDNSYVYHFFNMEKKIIPKADIFSTVSEAQGFFLIGELGICGRLTKETMGYRFVKVVPNSIVGEEFTHTKNIIKGVLTPKTSFVVLYSGGYNTWTDVKTMFYGLEKAMSVNPNLEFVSTGGQIDGHDEFTYNHFRKLIKNSKFKNRFHLCGWVPSEDLPNYYLESDLGINSDKYCYEALLGARTRALDWIKAGLPFISTPLSEVTQYLIQKELAYSFEQGDMDSLAKSLNLIINNKDDLELKKKNLKEIMNNEFISKFTLSEFKNWIQDPKFSPDHGNITNFISEKSVFVTIPSIPKKQKVAIAAWPFISDVLRKIGLKKYEMSVKQFGIDRVFPETFKKFKVKFLDIKIPSMRQNEKYFVPVRLKNIGESLWQTPDQSLNSVNFSFRWKDKNGNIITQKEQRTPLSHSVKPGQEILIDAIISVPENTGELSLLIDLVKENEFWFSELNNELDPITLSVNVKKKETKQFPKVSVIIVTYNSEKYIKECLDSIFQTDYPSLEIIVIDNASVDNTKNIVNNYGNKIKFIESKTNLGFAGGNNLGIKNSSGNILFFINPDAYVTKSSIKELVKPFLNDDKIMITGPKIYYPNTKKIQSAGGILGKNGLPLHIGYGQEDNPQFNFPRGVDYVTGAAIAIHRKFFEISGLFNTIYHPAYYEETEKCVRARKLGYKVFYIPSSIVYHYESTTLTALSEKYLKPFHTSRFRFIYRNFGFLEYLQFIGNELKWFFAHCGKKERSIVIKAHLKSMFNPNVRYRKEIPLE